MTTRLLLTLLVSVLALACAKVPEPPLRVAVNPWVGYDPLVLARERGLIDPATLQVIELPSATECKRALRNGLADAAALTLDEALRLADEGTELRIVTLLSDSRGADAVLARPGISSLAELRGKRIALEESALGSLMLARLLTAAGLTRDDVHTVHGEASQHAAMVQDGGADVVITFEPIRSQLLAAGLRVIFDSAELPGEIVDVLVVRADLVEHRVQQLRAAWRTGLAALEADLPAAAALLSPAADLTVEQYLATLDGLRFIPAAESAQRLDAEALALSAGPLAGHLQGLGLLQRPPDWVALTTDSGAAR